MAAAVAAPLRTVRRWPARLRAGGGAALIDGAGTNARVSGRPADATVAPIAHPRRRLRMTGAAIAPRPGRAVRPRHAGSDSRDRDGRRRSIRPDRCAAVRPRHRASRSIRTSGTSGGSTGAATMSPAHGPDAAIAARAGTSSVSPSMTRRGRPMSGSWTTTAALPPPASRCAPCAGSAITISARRTCAADTGRACCSRRPGRAPQWPGIRRIPGRPCTPETSGTAGRLVHALPRARAQASPGPSWTPETPTPPAGLTGPTDRHHTPSPTAGHPSQGWITGWEPEAGRTGGSGRAT